MRVTRDSLLRIAKETAQERAFNDKDIIAAYLSGSLLNVDPMLGGATDIDIVFVHRGAPANKREFSKLTPDFHLDIHRRAKDEFKSPRELRGDPWLGYEMYDPILLYEREKFFDFVQASLRAGFDFEQAPLMLQRCRKLLSFARRAWMELSEAEEIIQPKDLRKFMDSLSFALNSVAEISGPPIFERRMLLEFPARAEAAGKPEMTETVFQLMGTDQITPERLTEWTADWRAAFKAAVEAPGHHLLLDPTRLNYYEKAIQHILAESGLPLAALWPLMYTWTLAAESLRGEQLNYWESAAKELGFSGINFPARVEALDHLLDEIDVTLEEIAAANGVSDL